jgi:thiamine-monophosphate kinase
MSKTLADLGEKNLLKVLKKYLGKEDSIVRTFSEDCAVIDTGGRSYRLYTVDCLVEDVHFRRDYVPFYYVGRKAIKVNLSDIAAMGGTPEYYLVSIGAPPDTPVQVLLDIYDGMKSVTKDYGVQLIGGNLSSSSRFFLDVTVIGKVLKGKIIYRNGAKKGDSIFVTGLLGSSAEGLNLLKEGFRLTGDSLILPDHHRDSNHVMEALLAHMDPPCHVDVGHKLAQTTALTSMIDMSDGLCSDLHELCTESDVGATIDLQKLPVAPSVLYWERKRNRDPRLLALYGGEDYHLLFTVSKKIRDLFLRRVETMKLKVYEIGQIVSKSQGIQAVDENGKTYQLEGGYQHFVNR